MVESFGWRPVTSAMAAAARSVNGPGFGDEDVGVRRLPVEGIVHAAGRGGAGALLEQRFERGLAVAVVVADVEAGAGLAGNEIDGRIADVDRGEFEIRRRELRAAVVERRLQRGDQGDQTADRIVGAIRIGDVALPAGDDQRAVERAAPAGLDGVAEYFHIARLAEDAVVELFAALGRPLQQLDGAVDRDALLVAGDEQRDRAALRLAAVRRQIIESPRRRSRRCRLSCRPRRGRTSMSPATSPANGGCCHAASSPGGTTSVWPANTRLGFSVPMRA